ncbi:hypothetical protein FQZ97_1120380 [compost metagenome]
MVPLSRLWFSAEMAAAAPPLWLAASPIAWIDPATSAHAAVLLPICTCRFAAPAALCPCMSRRATPTAWSVPGPRPRSANTSWAITSWQAFRWAALGTMMPAMGLPLLALTMGMICPFWSTDEMGG